MATLSSIVADQTAEAETEAKYVEAPDIARVCFVSDTVPAKNSALDVATTKFDSVLFLNRNFSYLKELGLDYLWVDIRVADARTWLSQNLNSNTDYTIVNVYAHQKKSKWLEDIDCVKTLRLATLMSFKALTVQELVEVILNSSDVIHRPASRLMECFGCSTAVRSKKNDD
jgi:hypothetical protein